MNSDHFEREFSRAREVWGNNSYPKERLRVFWNSMKDLPDDWLTRTMDYFVAYLKHAPLMPEFSDQIARYREQNWSREKEQHAQDAKEMASMYTGEDISTICGQIIKRLKGNMSDADFESFNKMISPPGTFKCDRCQGTRLYFDSLGMTVCTHKTNVAGSRIEDRIKIDPIPRPF